MSRRIAIFGNWKMNLNAVEAVDLAKGLAREVGYGCPADVGVCPPCVYLRDVVIATQGSPVLVGAQNMYCEPPGAFTGETAGEMILDVGATHVILGHSERRHVIGETDELINRKVHRALALGLNVILCVGELLEEREAGQTEAVVGRQLTAGLAGVSPKQMSDVIVAYEPVWAIGTGKVATPDQAQDVHRFVRGRLAELCGADTAEAVRIQYGGSVKPGNASDLLAQPDIDGALVGGASLDVCSFMGIVAAVP